MELHPTVYLVGALAVSYVLYLAIQTTTTSIRRRKFIAEHGCQPPASRYPLKDPIFGLDALKELFAASKEHRLLELGFNRFQKLGPTWTSRHITTPTVHTIEPENVKTVLSLKFKDFVLDREKTLGPAFGRGIFVTDGEMWSHSRHMLRPNFAKEQVADIETFERHVQTMFKLIPRDGSVVDLQELFFRLTIDSATEFLFGQSVDSLKAKLNAGTSDQTESKFAEAFNYVQEDVATRFRKGAFVIFHRDEKAEESKKIVWAYIDQFVARAVQWRQTHDMEKKGEDDKYVFLQELATRTTDRKQMRDELLNILLAGRDTTASLLSNMFFQVSQRPDIWAKMRAEVEPLHGRAPTYEELKNMKYIRWCLNECESSHTTRSMFEPPLTSPTPALRLQPVVPGNSRFAVRDTVLPLGGGPNGQQPLFIAAGTRVLYSPYTMHRRKDYYGEDALEFKPERWEKLRPGWEYLPFNGGPRICLGQQYALTEAGYVAARICQEYKTLESANPGPWREMLSLTVSSYGGTQVKVTPA